MTEKQDPPSITEFYARERILDQTMEDCLKYFDEINSDFGWGKIKFTSEAREMLYEFLGFIYDGALEYYENSDDPDEQLRPVDAATLDKMIKSLLLEKMHNMRGLMMINELVAKVGELQEIIRRLQED